jgi:hypothetical protein
MEAKTRNKKGVTYLAVVVVLIVVAYIFMGNQQGLPDTDFLLIDENVVPEVATSTDELPTDVEVIEI